MQVATNNELFAEYAKNLASYNQSHINFWCSTCTVTQKNKINQNLLGQAIEVTFNDSVILEGIMEDIQIKSILDTYYDLKIGGNDMLGMPSNYSLNDFMYEIRNTLISGHSMSESDDIASIYIRANHMNGNKARTISGNQRGILKK